MDETPYVYVAEDWPHGLVCMDCNQEFVEGQPISERLVGIGQLSDGAPVLTVEIICSGCATVMAPDGD